MYFVKMAHARRAARVALTVLATAATTALLAGCMKEQDLNLATYVEQTDPADQLYNQALANLNAGRLKEASRKFDAFDRQHPYS
jgi:outer membrane protein assembly factor BamD